MTIIEQIKAEIERLKSIEYPCDNSQQATGFFNAIDRMTDFLDTLEEPDRPEPYTGKYDEAYLNEKIKKATESWKGVDVDAMLAECRGYDEEKSEKPMKQEELEEEYKDYVVNDPVYSKLVNRNAGLVIARHFAQWQKEQVMKDFPKWRRIKEGERLPCPAYVWTIVYDNYPGCFEGRLMPNVEGVRVGRDTWYLPVDVIHNLPKED